MATTYSRRHVKMTMPHPAMIKANEGKDYIDLGVTQDDESVWRPIFNEKLKGLREKAYSLGMERIKSAAPVDQEKPQDPRSEEVWERFDELSGERSRQRDAALKPAPPGKVPLDADTYERMERLYPSYEAAKATPGTNFKHYGGVEDPFGLWDEFLRQRNEREESQEVLKSGVLINEEELVARAPIVRARAKANKLTEGDIELMTRAVMAGKLGLVFDPKEYTSLAEQESKALLPGWVIDHLEKAQKISMKAAKQAGKVISQKTFKEEFGGVKGYTTDEELAAAAKKTMGEVQAAGATLGIQEARVERQEPVRKALRERGVAEEDMEKAMYDMTGNVVEAEMPSGITNISRRQFFINNLNASDTPEEAKKRTLAVYDMLDKEGFVDSEGEADPNAYLGVAFGRAGVKGLPKVSSPLSRKIQNKMIRGNQLVEEAAKGWEATIAARAKDVTGSDSLPEGAMWLLNNAGKDFIDMFAGFVDLAAWDTDDRKKALLDAYRKVVADEGARPLSSVEVELIDREANVGVFTGLLHGVKESFKRTFTDFGTSMAGSPIGTLANVTAMARAIAAGSVALPAGTRGAALMAQARRFLSKLDDELTLIPTAGRIAKKVPGAEWLGRNVKEFFRSPHRIELVRAWAINEGKEVARSVDQITRETKKRIDKGDNPEVALKEALEKANPKAAEAYASVMLEQQYGNTFGAVSSPAQVLRAILDDDQVRLRELVPEGVLEEAGVKAPFNPKNMEKPDEALGFDVIEVNAVAVNKKIDDALAQSGVDSKEVLELRRAVDDIRNRIAQGEKFTHPEIVPEPNLKEGSTGTPVDSALNQGVRNDALLVALVEEASKKEQNVLVSVRPEDKSFFVGHMVGPESIMSKIPVPWKSRLPLYEKRLDARASDLLAALKKGEDFDYALYLKRARNLERNPKQQVAFDELEALFLDKTGLASDEWAQVRIGGISPGASGMLEELYFRQTSRTPGAPAGAPALRGVARDMDYVDEFGNVIPPDALESGRLVGVRGEATPRMKAAAKAPAKTRRALQEMEERRMAQAEPPPVARAAASRVDDTVPDMPVSRIDDTAPVMPVSRIDDTAPVMPVFKSKQDGMTKKELDVFEQKQTDLVGDVLKRGRNMGVNEINNVLSNSDAIGKEVSDRAISRALEQELEIGAGILNGEDWVPGTKLMALPGSADEVSARLISSQGKRGDDFVKSVGIEDANADVKRYLNVGEDQKVSVPKYVNDAFTTKAWVDKMSRNAAFKAIQVPTTWIKRALTTRNPLTFMNNIGSGLFLRAIVKGDMNPEGLRRSLRDLKRYMEDPSKLDLETRQMFDTMAESGALGTWSASEIKSFKDMPLELFEEHWGATMGPKGWVPRKTVRAYNKALNKLERAYNMSDPVFKADHVRDMTSKYVDAVSELEAGRYVDVETGKNLTQRIYRNQDGTIRLGSVDGKVLSDADVRKMMVKKAIRSANKLYFDYADVPNVISAFRAIGIDTLLINPFFTWGWKALSIPLIKRGLADEVMSGAEHFTTNSPAVKQRMARNAMKNELIRASLINSSLSATRSEALKSPEILRFLSRYRAHTPISGHFNFGERESDFWSLSGMDPTTSQANFYSALMGAFGSGEKEVAKIASRDEDIIGTVDPDTGKITGGYMKRALLELPDNTKKDRKIRDEMKRWWNSRVKDNKDGHKILMSEVRKSHPMFDYDNISAFSEAFGIGRPLVTEIFKNRGRGRTTTDKLLDFAKFALVGSKGASKVLTEAQGVALEGKDPAALLKAFGLKRFPNKRFQSAINKMRNRQRERLRVEWDVDYKDPFDAGDRRIEVAAKQKLIDLLTEFDAQKLRNLAHKEAKSFGLDVEKSERIYRGVDLPKYIYKQKGDE